MPLFEDHYFRSGRGTAPVNPMPVQMITFLGGQVGLDTVEIMLMLINDPKLLFLSLLPDEC